MREVVNFLCFFNKLQGSEIQEQDVLYRKLVITVKGHEPMVLKSYETFVKQVCDNLSIALIR